jgi:hypothetical protein
MAWAGIFFIRLKIKENFGFLATLDSYGKIDPTLSLKPLFEGGFLIFGLGRLWPKPAFSGPRPFLAKALLWPRPSFGQGPFLAKAWRPWKKCLNFIFFLDNPCRLW